METVTTIGTWTSVSVPLPKMQGLNTKQVSWGDPYRPQNREGKQSSYRFEGVSGARVPLDGTEFGLGTFTHSNFSILTTAPRFQVVLKLALSFGQDGPRQEFSFTFDHNETPNTSGSIPDEVVLPDPQSQEIVTLHGAQYALHISGFRQNGKLVLKFISAEDRSNSAEIFARLVAVPVTADRTVEAVAGAAEDVRTAQAARAAAEAAAKVADEARAAEAAKAAAVVAKAAEEVRVAQAARAAAEATAKAADEARAAETAKAAAVVAKAAEDLRAAQVSGHHLPQERIATNCTCWMWIPIAALLVLVILSR